MPRFDKRVTLASVAAVVVLFTGASDVGCSVSVEQKPTQSSSPNSKEDIPFLKYGSVDPAVTQDNLDHTICKANYTRTVRPPTSYTERVKSQMMKEQNWQGEERPILDHYIPLQGGGHPTEIKNLQLQTKYDAMIKDRAGDKMKKDICTGRLTLREAQIAMGKGWENYEENSR